MTGRVPTWPLQAREAGGMLAGVATPGGAGKTSTADMQKLSRQTMDRVARAIVSGQRGYGARVDDLADHVAGMMRSRLLAAGVPRADRLQHPAARSDPARSVRDREALRQLLARVGKHLAWAVMAGPRDGGPHPH